MNIIQTIDDTTRANCIRFQRPQVASRYKNFYDGRSRNDQREWRAIQRCLKKLPAGCGLLDFPCGSGRLLGLLRERGFKVSGADSSPCMLKKVRAEIDTDGIALYERDIFDSGFEDNQFDAVICNRLFHHFIKSEDRRKAIAELRRISKGPVVLSFFNIFSLSMSYRILRKRLKGKRLTDRVPVRLAALKAEIESCGMKVSYDTAKHWGVSAMWYIVMERSDL